MEVPISKEQWEEWRINPVTQEVYRALRVLRQEQVDNLTEFSRVKAIEPNDDKVRGMIYGIDLILEMEVKD